MSIETTEQFWDCECDRRFIHPATRNMCEKCGAERDEQPDSRVNEIGILHCHAYGDTIPDGLRIVAYQPQTRS